MSTTKQVKNWQKTAFKKGQCANPGGRPKTAAFAEEVREFLKEKIGKDEKPRVRAILERLAKTKPEVLLHYAHGKPVETQVNVNESDADKVADALARKWAMEDSMPPTLPPLGRNQNAP
jgi:hypothetical protein